MSNLALEIKPSQASCDHQVRIRIDGVDWLGDESLGIDPPVFFAQESLVSEGKLLVGRCECGCEGCCDVWVNVIRTEREVTWVNGSGLRLSFNREEFDRLVASAREDFSWEDAKRTAERLATEVFAGTQTEDGYKFDWASARMRAGIITLSFSRSGDQKLYEFGWDGHSPASAQVGAKQFRAMLQLLKED